MFGLTDIKMKVNYMWSKSYASWDGLGPIIDNMKGEIKRLREEVELLRANQNSDAWHWWYPNGRCYLRRFPVNGMYALSTSDTKWQFRTIGSQEWCDVSTDRRGMLEYIAEIEAEEAK